MCEEFDVGDSNVDVYYERSTKARIEHRCDACKERIAPDHRYTRVSIVWEGGAETHKRCGRCQALHEHLRTLQPKESWSATWPDERLNCGRDYVAEHGDLPEHIAALAFALPGEC